MESNLKSLLEKYQELYRNCRELPDIHAKRETFLEVCGYPNYENVSSNILAFFLDAKEQHGAKELFIKSLLEEFRRQLDNLKLEDEGYHAPVIEVVKKRDFEFTEFECRREVQAKGRIDILIEFENDVFIIENKIEAELYNDLKGYRDAVKEKYIGKNMQVAGIVLSRYVLRDKQIKDAKDAGFVPITYSYLFKRIEKNLGAYIGNIDSEWLVFLKNFLNTYSDEEVKIDPDSVNRGITFFVDNYDDLCGLWNDISEKQKVKKEEKSEEFKELKRIKDVIDESRRKLVDEFRRQLDNLELEDEGYPAPVIIKRSLSRFSCYAYMSYALGIQIDEKKRIDSFEIWRGLEGWHILVRTGQVKTGGEVEKWLEEKGISERDTDILGCEDEKYFIVLKNFKGDEEKDVAKKANEILGKLRDA